MIDKRKLGKTREEVTILGLGGEGILRTFGHDEQAYGLINKAIDLGVNYCESAAAYSGSESVLRPGVEREAQRNIPYEQVTCSR